MAGANVHHELAPKDFTKMPMPASLSDWIRWFDVFFKKPNSLRAVPRGYCDLRDFGDRLAELGGYITSSKHQRSAVFWRYYAKYFAWYCGLASSAHLDLEQFVWQRFPGLCPYCGERPCVYLYNPGLRTHSVADAPALKARLGLVAEQALRADSAVARRPLRRWFEHFMTIYPANLHGSVGDIVERFHEEQSELLKEIRRADSHRSKDGSITDEEVRRKVLEEMSDLLSWYLTLGAKLAMDSGKGGIPMARGANGDRLVPDFDLVVYLEYRECHNCHEAPCDCGRDVVADRGDLQPEAPQEDIVVRKSDATAWLVNRTEIDLRDYAVVGKFVVGNEQRRQDLIKVRGKIEKGFKKTTKPYPVLLCGAPGSGKTTFAKELATSMKLTMHEASLANCTDIRISLEQAYLSLIQAAVHTPDIAALLNEFDTKVPAGGTTETAYRHLLLPLEKGTAEIQGRAMELPHVLWFFAGSTATTEDDFAKTLARENPSMGMDCLRRFRGAGQIVEFPIPEAVEDIAVLSASMAAELSPKLQYIESMALFYLVVRTWKDLGQLRGAVKEACDGDAGSCLRFYSFDDTDFAVEHEAEYRLLKGKRVRVRT